MGMNSLISTHIMIHSFFNNTQTQKDGMIFNNLNWTTRNWHIKYLLILMIFILLCTKQSSAFSIIKPEIADQILTRLFTQSHIPKISYQLKATYPLDNHLFMQGMFFDSNNKELTISSGLFKTSKIVRTNLLGKVLKERHIPEKFFGESITYDHGMLYQLTYQSGQVFVYDFENLNIEHTYQIPGEGWGITTLNHHFYISDGSEKIQVRTGSDFKLKKNISVHAGNIPIKGINDLTTMESIIVANIFPSSIIILLSPDDGQIKGWFDVSQFKESCSPDAMCVTNGLHYNPSDKTLFISGKRWSKIYQLKLL